MNCVTWSKGLRLLGFSLPPVKTPIKTCKHQSQCLLCQSHVAVWLKWDRECNIAVKETKVGWKCKASQVKISNKDNLFFSKWQTAHSSWVSWLPPCWLHGVQEGVFSSTCFVPNSLSLTSEQLNLPWLLVLPPPSSLDAPRKGYDVSSAFWSQFEPLLKFFYLIVNLCSNTINPCPPSYIVCWIILLV